MRRLQGFVTKSLGVALPGFRKHYDLMCDGVSGWSDGPVRILESNERYLIEPVAFPVMPDRHGRQYGRKFPALRETGQSVAN